MRGKEDYFYLVCGALISALGINMIASNDVVFGGISGLAIVVNSISKIPISITNLIANILLFLMGWKLIGRDFLTKSLFTIILQSIFLELTQNIHALKLDMLVSSIYGGIILGTGVAIVIKAGGSTGGTDMLALIINHLCGKSVPNCMFVIDASVIALGIFTFGINQALYALITIFFIKESIVRTTNKLRTMPQKTNVA